MAFHSTTDSSAGPSRRTLVEPASIMEHQSQEHHSLDAVSQQSSASTLRQLSSSSRHITHILADANDRPIFSLEFFPPKTNQGLSNLYMRIARMVSDLDPSWVQITWGAGGSTQQTSLELAGRVQNGILDPRLTLDAGRQKTSSAAAIAMQNGTRDAPPHQAYARNVCLHLTCTNVEKDSLDQTLDQALSLGICNILALRGDPPRGQETWVAADDRFQHATDLVKYIRQRHGSAFCIGVAAYPELHPDDAETLSRTDEMAYLLAKQDAGADFIVTQLFYDVENFLRWYADCRAHGVIIPIIPGVMPIQNYQTFRRVTSLCKATVPQSVWDAVEPVRFDDAAVRDVGVKLAKTMIQRICKETDIRAFHVCTLNLEKSIKTLLQELQWSVQHTAPPQAIKDDKGASLLDVQNNKQGVQVSRPKSDNLARIVGEELAANWDEFPNGRYGDARSPAFGQIDGYGVSLKVPPQDALKQWGSPTSADEISDIFVHYLQGELDVVPWCDCPILPETYSIRHELIRLNARSGQPVSEKGTASSSSSFEGKGWWTVGSQPSADGVASSDPVFGFGPSHGYIFQKAFVEFFASAGEMLMLEERINEYNAKRGGTWLSYFAGNRRGEVRTNVDANANESCAVTWGCFVGKEIVQSTIIEAESFKAWCEEAFAIWSEWELLFAHTSQTRKLLHDIGEQRWLVTVIHHDYKDEGALWKFLGVR